VLVLDDRSTDRTAAIVADLTARCPAVRLLRGDELPPGWGGKAHACQQLADAATGDWLLFVDADTTHAPGMLRTVVGAATAHGVEALTALPRERAESAGERLLVPQLFFFLLALQPLALLERAHEGRFVFANGQFFLVRRDLYLRVGGHAAVRDQLMEDLALGVRCKRAGARILLLDGGDWASCRMYDGFPAAWHGFLRSLQAGNRLAPTYLLGIGSMTFLYFAGPFVVLLALLLAGVRGRPLRLALGQVAALLALRTVVGRGLRQSATEIALFPPGVVVLSAAALATYWRILRGRAIEWRGRAYGDLTSPPAPPRRGEG
jgi:cellulose synthase/poly-beta-1,6-N-acetylglucosamine synthase-like glycosyltransferase